MLKVIKKDGSVQKYDDKKIISAVNKSASRCNIALTENELKKICRDIRQAFKNKDQISVDDIHNMVEITLDDFNELIAKSYRDYRNYKKDFVHMLDKVYRQSQNILYIGDKENSNTDSALVPTQRSLIFNELNKELYKKFFLTTEELQAIRDGYIYIHDMSARNLTMNCCLFDVANIMKNGFEMGNIWYNEPKTLDVAFDVLGDIILNGASAQYGGFTVPEVDKILEPYAKKSYKKYYEEYKSIYADNLDIINDLAYIDMLPANEPVLEKSVESAACRYAFKKVEREAEQGYQGIEMKLNSVGSSRGDYPFVTLTFGLSTSRLGSMISSVILNVHKIGQGKENNKIPTLFPKLVFLYDDELHGDDKALSWLYIEALDCSSKCMYPDFLSLCNEETTIGKMYKKYKKVISPMGKRKLSPYKTSLNLCL